MIKMSFKEAAANVTELAGYLQECGIQPTQEVSELANELRVWLNEKKVTNEVGFLAVLTYLASHARSGLNSFTRFQ